MPFVLNRSLACIISVTYISCSQKLLSFPFLSLFKANHRRSHSVVTHQVATSGHLSADLSQPVSGPCSLPFSATTTQDTYLLSNALSYQPINIFTIMPLGNLELIQWYMTWMIYHIRLATQLNLNELSILSATSPDTYYCMIVSAIELESLSRSSE